MSESPDVAVLFSGGRDSSLAAVRYCMSGRTIRLLKFTTGLGIPSNLPLIREQELRRTFPRFIADDTPLIPIQGIVRKFALADIESDFRTFAGKNLVLLGEKLALHCAAIIYCLRCSIGIIADGTSGYQMEMPEQRTVAVDFFRDLSRAFGIRYETPVIGYASSQEVRFALLEAGLSTKSLEGLSMFADTFSYANDDTILAYLNSKRESAISLVAEHTATIRTSPTGTQEE